MNRFEQETHNNIARIATALEKLIKYFEIAENDRKIKTKNKSMERDKVSKR